MKFILSITFILLMATLSAQVPYNSALSNGYTRKAIVAEQVGSTLVTITYHRPAVKGREGKIWGGVVHAGFADQGFGNGKPAPWRAGANENTIIELDNDVTVEGQPLAKGKYALFIAYGPEESLVIFSKRSDGWGSFFYDEANDVLRVKVKPLGLARSVEYLEYAFTPPTANSVMITLSWEKLSIPFKVEVDQLKQQFELLVSELQHPRSFNAHALNAAAAWCLQNNYQLDKALEWAIRATGTKFPGDPSAFPFLTTRADLLYKLGRKEDATGMINYALSFGNMLQLQQYGRQLIAAKRLREALNVFEFNMRKNPGEFVSMVGMTRGLSANGEYVQALAYAVKALPLAPNEANKQAVQLMIDKLKAGKDVN
jgi:tetratricopeptide (TPR) repeat protein